MKNKHLIALITALAMAMIPASAFTRGDLNSDGAVDVSDVNAVVNIMLGKAQQGGKRLLADVTRDGTIDVSDVNMVVNIMLGRDEPVPAADVDGNGSVDVSDVNAIINIMLGK